MTHPRYDLPNKTWLHDDSKTVFSNELSAWIGRSGVPYAQGKAHNPRSLKMGAHEYLKKYSDIANKVWPKEIK